MYRYPLVRRLLVLSNLHPAPPFPLGIFCEGEALAVLLIAHAGPGRTLVLAGDTIDLLYLVPRPPLRDMPRSPALIQQAIDGINSAHWGPVQWAALGQFDRSGGTIVVMPGNHYPELPHPDTPGVLARAWGLSDLHAKIVLHAQTEPWNTLVGTLPVRVVHGPRRELWNDIDPAAVARAMATGDSNVGLPPGSRIVLEPPVASAHSWVVARMLQCGQAPLSSRRSHI